jgi:hypothetical protein
MKQKSQRPVFNQEMGRFCAGRRDGCFIKNMARKWALTPRGFAIHKNRGLEECFFSAPPRNGSFTPDTLKNGKKLLIEGHKGGLGGKIF